MPAMVNNLPWVKGKKKKLPDGAAQSAVHKPKRLVERSMHINFNNVPSFEHVERKHRPECLRQHREFESEMACQPEGVLHNQLTGRHATSPRQHLAFLIAKYCVRRCVTHSDFFRSLQQQGGDSVLETPGLITQPKNAEERAVVNLLALPDQTLWNMYVAVPEEFRPAERPKPPPREPVVRAPKRGRGRRGNGVLKIARNASGELTVSAEQVVWACCDKCSKWRRLFNTTEDELPDSWVCSMHPDELTCDLPEDAMEDGEAWDNEVHGTAVLPPVEQEEEQEEQEEQEEEQPSSATSQHSPRQASPTPAGAGDAWLDDDDW